MSDISKFDLDDKKPMLFKNQSQRKFMVNSRQNCNDRSLSRSKFDSNGGRASNHTPSTKEQHIFVKRGSVKK